MNITLALKNHIDKFTSLDKKTWIYFSYIHDLIYVIDIKNSF